LVAEKDRERSKKETLLLFYHVCLPLFLNTSPLDFFLFKYLYIYIYKESWLLFIFSKSTMILFCDSYGILLTNVILQEWGMLSLIRSLKSKLRSANAVAVITFPPSLLSPSFCKRWQHMADVLLSVRAIPGLLFLTSAFALFILVFKLLNRCSFPDEDKELGKLRTGYQDMVGFLNVHKIACVNTQVQYHYALLLS